MKVNGQLENAQLEQIANASPTPTSTGRVYADVTAPLAAVPRFFNGTSWQALAIATTGSTVSQNSGKSVTVNWATGLIQKVVLTDNTVISFSNPVVGQIHTLIVQQANTDSGSGVPNFYLYTLNMTDQATQGQDYQPRFGYLRLGQSKTYAWYYETGIEAAQSNFQGFQNTNTAPLATAMGLSISSDGKTIAMAASGTPYHSYYNLASSNFPKSLFGGLNLVTPATAVGVLRGVAYAPGGNEIYTASQTTPYINGYFLDRNTGVGTAFANPGTLPTGAGQCIAVHPSGLWAGIGHATTPFMSIYPVRSQSATNFGTKLTNPVTLPAAAVSCMAWSHQGDYLAVGSPTTPFIQVWPFAITAAAGATATFGAVASNPATLPSTGPTATFSKAIAWRPQGDYIAMADATSLYVIPFSRSAGTFGTRLTVATSVGSVTGVRFSPCGTYIYISGDGATNTLQVFDFSGFVLTSSSFVAIGNPATDVEVSPSGDHIFVSQQLPALSMLRAPRRAKNYLLINNP